MLFNNFYNLSKPHFKNNVIISLNGLKPRTNKYSFISGSEHTSYRTAVRLTAPWAYTRDCAQLCNRHRSLHYTGYESKSEICSRHILAAFDFVFEKDQLLELRTSNYQLSDRCRKLEHELTNLQLTASNYEKELQKANKTISKSKKAKDVEALLSELDSLQQKLHSQEEDFRLQNSTLMEELSKLCTSNEELEKEVSRLKTSQSSVETTTNADSDHQGELRRLQALNTVLQKNLNSTQERYEAEIATLKQTISNLSESSAALGERMPPAGAPGDDVTNTESPETTPKTPGKGTEEQSALEGGLNGLLADEFEAFLEDVKLSDVTSEFDDDVEPKDPVTVLQGHAKQLKHRLSGALVRNMESLVKLMSKDETEPRSTDSSDSATQGTVGADKMSKELNDLQLIIDTEREEKRLLKEQLQRAEESHKAEVATLSQEVAKLTEKTKKKQESLLQLQNEKEQLYSDGKKQINNLQTAKEKEAEDLKKEKLQVLEELTRAKQAMAELKESTQQRIQELEASVRSLNVQVQSVTAEECNRYKDLYATAHRQLEDLKQSHSKLLAEKDECQSQLADCLNTNSRLNTTLREVQNDRDNLHRDLQEARKSAEKRKTMLDDLAIQTQTIKQQHENEMARATEAHVNERDILRQQLQEQTKLRKELEPLRDQLVASEEKVQSLENTKGWFERRLAEVEEELQKTKESHREEVHELRDQHSTAIQEMKEEETKKSAELSQSQEQIEKLQKDIDLLKQDAKDSVEERKLGEKKGYTMVKDLKRQLRQERKRGDKLQERLQELLTSGSQGRAGIEELFQDISDEDRQKHDSSSVSSWSTSGQIVKDTAENAPSPNGSMMSAALSEETTELISRMTELQTANWALEEKVRHLEESNACMADDLLKKTAIIETHVMERKVIGPTRPQAQPETSRKAGLKKVMDFVKGEDGSQASNNQREMNQKLQVMLEETLTKNMHLQQDIQMLSEEVVRLSKLAPLASSTSPLHPSHQTWTAGDITSADGGSPPSSPSAFAGDQAGAQ
ncbi:GRIP1-associated protein 1-like isoform X2 [Acanthaster planci]|uniref:GRIP1-associated protein 1-like isoform X2 n=1 Tax=Acanthaster planci TaxID=133434 RepID=A0A8B7XKG1_ACAPL|nr:GRIP1-associated protein 1-like isoform X2 [Acanthaster planci]